MKTVLIQEQELKCAKCGETLNGFRIVLPKIGPTCVNCFRKYATANPDA
jgi:hypothetical protein